MKVSFEIQTDLDNTYRIILSSGEDAFFATQDVYESLNDEVEIVEIDLERVQGNDATTPATLSLIAEGIAKYFIQNEKAILYYYCDDLAELPKSPKKGDMWPQEYRSHLFSLMFQRYMLHHGVSDITDTTIIINQGPRPLYMHLIARKLHERYIEVLKSYIQVNYGK